MAEEHYGTDVGETDPLPKPLAITLLILFIFGIGSITTIRKVAAGMGMKPVKNHMVAYTNLVTHIDGHTVYDINITYDTTLVTITSKGDGEFKIIEKGEDHVE